MEEELQKRNTDCVYFLASPLTCKKGLDCEYRHSEIARLNPRECWYWLSGSCLNPNCGFRHPPLDVHKGGTSESAPTSIPVNKTIVPCYFYFNGFCNKGGRCGFLHDINADAPPGEKLVETTLANSQVPNPENNTSAVRESGSVAANEPFMQQQTSKPLNSSASAKAEDDITVQSKEQFQLSMPEDVMHKSGSSLISVSECEETATIRSDSPPAERFVHSISYAREDNSSEERVDNQIEPEERWESSPGFDVLVDDERENVDSEDESEYIMALDGERRDNSHFMGYDFENQVEYDSRYAEMELQYERETYHHYNHPVSGDIFSDLSNISDHVMSGSILSRKRKLIPMELASDNQSHADLRDHLRRRKFSNSHSVTVLSRMRESNQLSGRIHGNIQPHESFTSAVGRSSIESPDNNRAYSNGGRRHGFPKQTQKRQSRRPYKEKQLRKRRFPSSEVSTKTVPRERRSARGCSTFSGPKTLAQIKEEKRKSENGNLTKKTRSFNRKSSIDFQGPKPLSEILKDKGKLPRESEGKY